MDHSEDPEEILLGRVLDRAAGPDDWRALELAAARDSTLWRRLASTALAENELLRATREPLARASQTALPPVANRVAGRATAATRAALGWAAALILAVAWSWSALGTKAPADSRVPDSSVVTMSPEQALDSYRAAGTRDGWLVAELPRVMLATEVEADGSAVEVFALRRFVERAHVDQLYQLGFDDGGQLKPVSVGLPALDVSSL
ncbi:MAG: hypothetical protein AB7O52_15425 [Planctomycetota bacterium]